MNIKETPQHALVIAMTTWQHKDALSVLSLIMCGEKVPGALVNAAIANIERHPTLDTLEQDAAIDLLKRNAATDYCPF